MIILPGDPEFELTLGIISPPSTAEAVFIVRAGSLLMEPVSPAEATEYLYGGEYEERLAEIDADETTAELIQQ